MDVRTFLKNYWKSAFVAAVILYLSFTPPSTFEKIPSFENEDKLVHMLIYFGLTCMLIFDFKKAVGTTRVNFNKFLIACFVFPVFLGGIVEIIQPRLIYPRTGSWFDWLADIAGVLLGWAIMYLLRMSPKFTA